MNALFDTVERAVGAGILPARANEVVREEDTGQPWPAVLLSFIGAQFAVWPILGFIFLGVGEFLYKDGSLGVYVIGVVLLIASLVILRGLSATGFVGQLAFTALLVGDFLWVFGLSRDLGSHAPLLTAFLITGGQVALAFLQPVRWIQTLLGGGACAAFIFAYVFLSKYGSDVFFTSWWFIGHITAALVWAAVVTTEPRWAGRRYAATLSSLSTGWGVILLLSIAYVSNGMFERIWGSSAAGHTNALLGYQMMVTLSMLLTAGSGAALLWFWRASLPVNGRWLVLLAFIALTAMARFVPSAEVAAIMLAAALLTHRPRMAALALLVLLCLLSKFYYALSMNLVDKAKLVMWTGAALAIGTAIVSYFFKRPASAATQTVATNNRWKLAAPLIALGALLTLGAANYSIWQKERVIAEGQKLYVALAPRDPRSLMQGDYMALSFGMPGDVIEALGGDRRWWREEEEQVNKPFSRRASVVAVVDAKNIATVLRVATGNETLAAGEVLLPVQYKSGNWALVTDAFFFPEGAGKSLEGAKFGELRALGNGQALLVGLADENLKPLASLPDAKFDEERDAQRSKEEAPGGVAVDSVPLPGSTERVEPAKPTPSAKK